MSTRTRGLTFPIHETCWQKTASWTRTNSKKDSCLCLYRCRKDAGELDRLAPKSSKSPSEPIILYPASSQVTVCVTCLDIAEDLDDLSLIVRPKRAKVSLTVLVIAGTWWISGVGNLFKLTLGLCKIHVLWLVPTCLRRTRQVRKRELWRARVPNSKSSIEGHVRVFRQINKYLFPPRYDHHRQQNQGRTY